MQVTETLNQGLKREFKIVVPAATLEGKLSVKLDEIKARANIPGFRPGKVPIEHLRRLYGKSMMAEIVNDTVAESTRTVSAERQLKLAGEPKIVFPESQAEIEAVITGRADLAYSMSIEVLPAIELGDFKGVKLVREVTEVTDKDVEDALKRIADANRPYTDKGNDPAQSGDKVTIDYVGSIDGVPFEGGKDEGAGLVLGANQFIPGFEDQLIGARAGEQREVKVTFPAEYPAAHLAGKDAVFAVTVRDVSAPGEVTVDDAFAKTLGLESREKLEAAIRDQIAREDAQQSRRRVKRRLLDALDARYRFDLPEGLVEQEFSIIWRNLTADMERSGRGWADEGTTEEAARADYRGIAERRVRLGLLLAEIGERNAIKVPDEEVQRALFERARQYPGQERKVLEFYQNNPGAIAELRGPLFEEKVIDFLLELAEVTEAKLSREALFKDEDETAPVAEEAKAEEAPKPKKPRATKKKAEAE